MRDQILFPAKIEWDLTNGPLSKLLELLDTQVFSGSVHWVLLEISWTVDGRNPAPVDMVNISLFTTGFLHVGW